MSRNDEIEPAVQQAIEAAVDRTTQLVTQAIETHNIDLVLEALQADLAVFEEHESISAADLLRTEAATAGFLRTGRAVDYVVGVCCEGGKPDVKVAAAVAAGTPEAAQYLLGILWPPGGALAGRLVGAIVAAILVKGLDKLCVGETK